MSPSCDYPLRFQPLFRRYLWGGRRLETLLNKPIGDGNDYAESWEVVDHGSDQSIVQHGPAAELTLQQLVADQPQQLFGRHAPLPQFPLLMKLLDCNRTLSVQVHPNDAQAALLDPPDLGKTEAWVVLAADQGSKIYAGLKPGVSPERLRRAIDQGNCDQLLHVLEPQVGDCVFIPAGTVHALGAGLVIAEIQQASDTTFRLFDWNRVDAAGQSRPLHVESSLATIDFDRGPVAMQQPTATGQSGRERLVECDKFVMERSTLDTLQRVGGDDRFHLLLVVEGAVEVADDRAGRPLALGESCLLPAAVGAVELTPVGRCVLLDTYLP